MYSPASFYRFCADHVLIPFCRDFCSRSLGQANINNSNLIMQDTSGHSTTMAVSLPEPGYIASINLNQYLYNQAGSYELREFSPLGQRVYQAAEWLRHVDEITSWIALIGFIVLIASLILVPMAESLFQGVFMATTLLAAITATGYKRHIRNQSV